MRIRWTKASAEDLEHIKNYLTENHPHFAHSTVRELYEVILSLRTSPRRGRLGREEGTRELVLSRLPYIVAPALYRRGPHQGAGSRGFAHFPRRTEPPVRYPSSRSQAGVGLAAEELAGAGAAYEFAGFDDGAAP